MWESVAGHYLMAQNLLPHHLQNKLILILLILIYINYNDTLQNLSHTVCAYFDRGCMTYLSKGPLLTKSLWEVLHVIWYTIRSEFSLLFSDFVGIVRHFKISLTILTTVLSIRRCVYAHVCYILCEKKELL